MIVDSHRLGAGRGGRRNRRRPDRARARRRQRRSRCQARSVPPRPLAARLERAQSGAALGVAGGGDSERRQVPRPSPQGGDGETSATLDRRHARLCLSRSRRAQPRQWQLCARQWPRRRGRADLGAGARALYRGRRIDRHGGAAAASCWRRRSRRKRSSSASPTRSKAPKRFPSIVARWRLRARRKRTLHAITLSEAPMALSPSAETARMLGRWPDRRRARQTAVVESR